MFPCSHLCPGIPQITSRGVPNEKAVYHGGKKWWKCEKNPNQNKKHFELWNQASNLMLNFHTRRNATKVNESEMCVEIATEMNESEMCAEIILYQRLWDMES